ncbi:MAG TPA: hypothetical protein VLG76_01045 [Rhabdochlamydiaceae bacterium]|nr:hypothetical protein [Rhabdochlamydiaceae bacterium]
MKTLIIIPTILICSILLAEETPPLEFPSTPPTLSINPNIFKDSKPARTDYFYTDLGATYFIPTPGIGWRNQDNHYGVDLSFKVPILVYFPVAYKGSASFLYYPNPDPMSQFYYGIGITGMLPTFKFFNTTQHGFIGPCLMIGKSYINDASCRRFWQIVADVYPNKKRRFEKVKRGVVPLISFSYGFCY